MTFPEYKEKYGIRLNESQSEAVLRTEGNTLLLAVPGSGKTTVIVSRLGYMIKCLGVPYFSILTLTYSVAACRDMRERYISYFGDENVPQFRTIHGICAIIIKEYERAKGRTAFELFDGECGESELLSECFRAVTGKFPETGDISEIMTAMTYVRNMMLDITEISSHTDLKCDVVKICRAYSEEKRRRRLMDYDDQLEFALKILRQYPDILNSFRRRYPYINVDEAQDTSKIQHEIIRLLSSGNLFMVGDEDQSIYGFRAAYPEALLSFEKVYDNAKILFMEQNFRSTGLIIKRASRLISNNRERRKKHMYTEKADGKDIETVGFPTRADQYTWICNIAEKVALDKETTAVLFRNNDSALILIDSLEKRKIPYRCREADFPFFEHRGVSDVLMLLDAVYSGNVDSFSAVAKRLGCGFTDSDVAKITEYSSHTGKSISFAMRECISQKDERYRRVYELSGAMERATRARISDGIYMLCRNTSFARFLDLRFPDMDTKIGILTVLASDCQGKAELDKKLLFLRNVIKTGKSPDGNAIILSTVHSSKGLEYDNVIIIDVRDGEFPSVANPARAQSNEISILEEERRLFYVAVTRARKSVRITAYASDFDSRTSPRSTFVSELMRYDASAFGAGKRSDTDSQKNPFVGEGCTDISKFAEGKVVIHKNYGEGVIKEISNDKCTVSFDGGVRKSFSISTAISSGFLILKDREGESNRQIVSET